MNPGKWTNNIPQRSSAKKHSFVSLDRFRCELTMNVKEKEKNGQNIGP